VSETQTPDSLGDESIAVMIQNSAQWRRKDVVVAPGLQRHLVGRGNLLVENKILKVFKNI